MLPRESLLPTHSGSTISLNTPIYQYIDAFHGELLAYFRNPKHPQSQLVQLIYDVLVKRYILIFIQGAMNPQTCPKILQKQFTDLLHAFIVSTTPDHELSVVGSENMINITNDIEGSTSFLAEYESERKLFQELIELYNTIALLLHDLAIQEQSDREIDELQTQLRTQLNELNTQSRELKKHEQTADRLAQEIREEKTSLPTLGEYGNQIRDIDSALDILKSQIKKPETQLVISTDEKKQEAKNYFDNTVLFLTHPKVHAQENLRKILGRLSSAIEEREHSLSHATQALSAAVNTTYKSITQRSKTLEDSIQKIRDGIAQKRTALVNDKNAKATAKAAETADLNARFNQLKLSTSYPRLRKALKFAGTFILGAAVAVGIIFSGGSLLLGLGLGAATAIGFSTRVFRRTENLAPISAPVSYVVSAQNIIPVPSNSSSTRSNTKSINHLLHAHGQSTLTTPPLSKDKKEQAASTFAEKRTTARFQFAAKPAVIPEIEDDDTLSIKYGYI